MTGRSVCVETAALAFANDGVAFSQAFGDLYHSVDGGLAQARKVFLEGNGLPLRWRGRDAFTILETGFGLGLNFLAAWDALRADAHAPRRLHFVSVEKFPFRRDELVRVLAPFAEIEFLSRALTDQWPPPLAGFHRIHFDAGRVILTLLLGDARELLPQLVARADALFLDGFSPARNPEMWSPDVVRELARLCAPGATLATWTVAGGVRGALSNAGFRIEKREGFGKKREMLVGEREGEAAAPRRDRNAIVVGAGLAGMTCAERLATRGWQVDLVDARATRASTAVGLVRPIANVRDALNARISRSAFLYALQHYRALQYDGYHLQWERCGALQIAADADEAARFAAIAGSQGYPPEFLEYVDADQAREIAGRAVGGPGWWIPSGACISLESLSVASVARAGSGVRKRLGKRVERIEREGREWRALDAEGRVIAAAYDLIIANAADAKRLVPDARLTLSSVRGQVTYLPASPARHLACIVSGNGYVAPLPGGGHCIGASYRHDDADDALRAEEHRENLARAESLLPGFTEGVHPMGLEGWAGFRATVPDRLPIFGATAIPGVHVATGLGSRGLLWAPLGAEILACELEGEPMPLPRDLMGAMSPRRFLS